MNKTFHGALVFLAILCLCPAAYGQSDSKDSQDAELRFSIQMTSALNNDPKGQFLVAEMYEQGVGTPQNLRMAHLWYTKSANQKYGPAIKRLASWGSETQQNDATRERAEEQKRRQAEANAAAAATAKATRERAEEQKRRQAEADAAAAATAKATRERAEEQKRRQVEANAAAAAAATAKATRERAEEQKRRQVEADAAAAIATTAVKAAQAAETAPIAKEKQPETNRPKDKSKGTTEKIAEKADTEFKANPCKTPTAKFTSTCQ